MNYYITFWKNVLFLAYQNTWVRKEWIIEHSRKAWIYFSLHSILLLDILTKYFVTDMPEYLMENRMDEWALEKNHFPMIILAIQVVAAKYYNPIVNPGRSSINSDLYLLPKIIHQMLQILKEGWGMNQTKCVQNKEMTRLFCIFYHVMTGSFISKCLGTSLECYIYLKRLENKSVKMCWKNSWQHPIKQLLYSH